MFHFARCLTVCLSTMDMKSEGTIATMSYVSLQAPRLGKMVSLSKASPCVYPQYWLLQLTSGGLVSLSYRSIVGRRKINCNWSWVPVSRGNSSNQPNCTLVCTASLVLPMFNVVKRFNLWIASRKLYLKAGGFSLVESLKFSDCRTFEPESTLIMELPGIRWRKNFQSDGIADVLVLRRLSQLYLNMISTGHTSCPLLFPSHKCMSLIQVPFRLVCSREKYWIRFTNMRVCFCGQIILETRMIGRFVYRLSLFIFNL